ncbi:hypothetical protein PFISCL1PPCAC_419, partial [Pristionchus fissidentatus]
PALGAIKCDWATGRYEKCKNCKLFCDDEALRDSLAKKAQQHKDYNKSIITGMCVGGILLMLITVGGGVFLCMKPDTNRQRVSVLNMDEPLMEEDCAAPVEGGVGMNIPVPVGNQTPAAPEQNAPNPNAP